MVGHKSLSGAGEWSEEIIVTSRVWHPRTTLPSASVPDENALVRAPPGRIGSLVPLLGWVVDDLPHVTRERRVRDLGHVRVPGDGLEPPGSPGGLAALQVSAGFFAPRRRPAGVGGVHRPGQ